MPQSINDILSAIRYFGVFVGSPNASVGSNMTNINISPDFTTVFSMLLNPRIASLLEK